MLQQSDPPPVVTLGTKSVGSDEGRHSGERQEERSRENYVIMGTVSLRPSLLTSRSSGLGLWLSLPLVLLCTS